MRFLPFSFFRDDDENKPEAISEEESPSENPPAFDSDDEASPASAEDASTSPTKANAGKISGAFANTYRRIGRSLSMVRDSFTHENRSKMLKRCRSLVDRTWKDPKTAKFSWLRILQNTLILGVLVFLVNAFIVTLAFWKASRLDPRDITLDSLTVSGLDQDSAVFSFHGKLADSFLMKHVQMEIFKPIIGNVYLKPSEASSMAHSPSNTPLLSFSIPTGQLVDKKTLAIGLPELIIQFNSRFPMASLVDILRSKNVDDLSNLIPLLPKIIVQLEYGVATKSFWISLWLSGKDNFTIDLAKEAAELVKELKKKPRKKKTRSKLMEDLSFHLSKVEFEEKDGFSVASEFSLNHPLIPKVVDIQIPDLAFSLAMNNEYFLDFSLPKHSISRQEKKDELKISSKLSIPVKYRAGIHRLLYSIQKPSKDDKKWILSTAAKKSSAPEISGLPKWLETLVVDVDLVALYSTIKQTGLLEPASLSVSDLPSLLLDSPSAYIKFAGPSEAADSLETGISVNISPWANLAPEWLWSLPCPAIKTSIWFQNRQSERVDIADITLKKIESSSPSLLDFTLLANVKADALVALTSFAEDALAFLEGSMLVINGNSDYFLSSLLEPLALTITPGFRLGLLHGKPDVISNLLDSFLTDFDLTTLTSPAFNETIQHRIDVSVASTNSSASVSSKISLAPGAVIDLPFVQVSWEAFSVGMEIDKATLGSLSLETGQTRLFLDALKNPLALLHDGEISSNLSFEDSQSFISAWRNLVRDFVISGSNKLPVSLAFKSGDRVMSSSIFLPTLTTFVRIIQSLPVLKTDSVLPENWREWFDAFAASEIKMSGFSGLTTQLLLALPQLEISGKPKPLDSVAILLNLSLPDLALTLCRRAPHEGK